MEPETNQQTNPTPSFQYTEQASPRRLSPVVWLLIVIGVALVLFGGWKLIGGSSKESVQATASTTSPENQAAVEKEMKDLMAAVSQLIILPNEMPTVATILDAKKLTAEQVFYQGAQNGDKLLVFAKAQKAVIYSPSRNILVNVGPVYFNGEAGSGKPASSTNKK